MTGVGQVASAVSSRLANNPELDIDYYTPLRVFPDLASLEQMTPAVWALRTLKKAFRHLPFKEALRRKYVGLGLPDNGYDVYWEPNFIPVDQIQARKIVTTVHDMSFHENPSWHPRDRVAFMEKNFFKKIDRSDIVVTVSAFSKDKFLEAQTQVAEDRVHVVYNGIDHELFKVYDKDVVSGFKREMGLPGSFLLFVGTMEPRKNLQLLLSAYGAMSETFKEEFPLILVGDVGWKNKTIFNDMENQKGYVKWLGYLEKREDLALLYNAASVFIYPSLYEGFGIPPLEAMACGTPVCLSSIPVFHEVFGNDSAVYADPFDPESLRDALERLFVDTPLRESLSRHGLELAKRYTWDDTYSRYADLFSAQ
jgi:glycosyltransferase involved in cell wall biosynthesis